MRKFLCAAGAAAALVLAMNPAEARASWLSQFLHSYFTPGYSVYSAYGPVYYNPVYPAAPPAYPAVPPGYTYSPWYGSYATPYYAPYPVYRYGPAYPRPGYDWHAWHERNERLRHEWWEHHHR